MNTKVTRKLPGLSRRDFIKKSAAVGAVALTAQTGKMFAAGSDTIRVGLVGCGGRGTYDTTNCLNSTDGVQLVAMGDLLSLIHISEPTRPY